jgi:putative hydrolase of the HAD superfamily
VSDAQVNRAKQLRFNFIERALVPKTDSLQVLSDLNSECYLTGLVSNCSTEASIIWPKTPFARLIDVAIFSSTAGLQKPDPRIYQLAIGQLSVKPEICLYVGDGDSHELSGAAEVGLHPVLVRDSNKDNSDAMRNDAEIDKWDGPVISSLTEIIKLLK